MGKIKFTITAPRVELAQRIVSMEASIPQAPTAREKTRRRAYANGLREALEIIDIAVRCEQEGGEPVEMRDAEEIVARIQEASRASA